MVVRLLSMPHKHYLQHFVEPGRQSFANIDSLCQSLYVIMMIKHFRAENNLQAMKAARRN